MLIFLKQRVLTSVLSLSLFFMGTTAFAADPLPDVGPSSATQASPITAGPSEVPEDDKGFPGGTDSNEQAHIIRVLAPLTLRQIKRLLAQFPLRGDMADQILEDREWLTSILREWTDEEAVGDAPTGPADK